MSATIRKASFLLLGTLSSLLAAVAPAVGAPVAVQCLLKVRYHLHTELPAVDLLDRFSCEGRVVAVSDIDAADKVTRQVAFRFDRCPRLPATVVFSGDGVTEVRQRRADRLRAHVFAGECRGCVIAASTDAAAPRLDSGHFDGTFVVRADDALDTADIMLPAGRGHLTLRSERTDDAIVRAAWVAGRCAVVPQPPIHCGGIAGVTCPDDLVCVDWTSDDCDPDAGGADCVGVCVARAPQ